MMTVMELSMMYLELILPEKVTKEILSTGMGMEHMKALISDAFWYFICIEFKEKQEYEAHCEFLLDRMAANYVSYTLVEDPSICSEKMKKKFFTKFYNHLAQAVYFCLRTAFPKNRH